MGAWGLHPQDGAGEHTRAFPCPHTLAFKHAHTYAVTQIHTHSHIYMRAHTLTQCYVLTCLHTHRYVHVFCTPTHLHVYPELPAQHMYSHLDTFAHTHRSAHATFTHTGSLGGGHSALTPSYGTSSCQDPTVGPQCQPSCPTCPPLSGHHWAQPRRTKFQNLHVDADTRKPPTQGPLHTAGGHRAHQNQSSGRAGIRDVPAPKGQPAGGGLVGLAES